MPTFNSHCFEADDLFLAPLVKITDTFVSKTIIPLESVQEVEGVSPEILSVAVVDSTHIRINFKYAAVDNTALSNIDNYVITPTLQVYSITPESVASPTYVILEIDEQKTGESYTVELQRIVRS